MSPALPLKLLVIYCLKVRCLFPLIQKRPTNIKIKDLLIMHDLFVRCALFTESFLPLLQCSGRMKQQKDKKEPTDYIINFDFNLLSA